jgi:hypothetical protein
MVCSPVHALLIKLNQDSEQTNYANARSTPSASNQTRGHGIAPGRTAAVCASVDEIGSAEKAGTAGRILVPALMLI